MSNINHEPSSIDEVVKRVKATLSNPPGYDAEDFHVTADRCLCELLTALGYGEIVELYEKVEKWYA
jgi:hypothetical protein